MNTFNDGLARRLTAIEGLVHTNEEFEEVPRRVEQPRHQPARRLEQRPNKDALPKAVIEPFHGRDEDEFFQWKRKMDKIYSLYRA